MARRMVCRNTNHLYLSILTTFTIFLATFLSASQLLNSEYFPYPERLVMSCNKEDYFIVFNQTLHRFPKDQIKAMHVHTLEVKCDELIQLKATDATLFPISDFMDAGKSLVLPQTSNDHFCDTFHERNFKICDKINIANYKFLADFHFGRIAMPLEYHHALQKIQYDDSKGRNRNQTVVSIESNEIGDFIKNHLPSIEGYIVLLSVDTPTPVPGRLNELVATALKSPRLLHWYTIHCDNTLHEGVWNKFSCLPEGLSQWGHAKLNMQHAYELGLGLKDGLFLEAEKLHAKKRVNTVLVAFTVRMHPEHRASVNNYFCGPNATQWVGLVRCVNENDATGRDNITNAMHLYKAMTNFRFVASPRGSGIDCYRNYETLLMGAFPIVMSSSLDSVFRNLPVLIIKRWEDVTPKLLDQKYEEFKDGAIGGSYDYRSLYLHHWNETIRSHFRDRL